MTEIIPPVSTNTEENNRGYDNRMDGDSPPPISITLENVDNSILSYLKDKIAPTVTDNGKAINVPIIYANPERWATIQRDGYIRDEKNDKLQAPIISIRRIDVSRNNMTNPSNKYVHKTFMTQWNRRNAYDRFAVQNNIRPSQQHRTVMIPDYINVDYEAIIWTDYEVQMNQLIEQINFENEEWWGDEQFKFRTRIDQYNKDSRLPPLSDRVVRSTFNLRVFAYLLPEFAVTQAGQASTNADVFTRKKVVTIVETEI